MLLNMIKSILTSEYNAENKTDGNVLSKKEKENSKTYFFVDEKTSTFSKTHDEVNPTNLTLHQRESLTLETQANTNDNSFVELLLQKQEKAIDNKSTHDLIKIKELKFYETLFEIINFSKLDALLNLKLPVNIDYASLRLLEETKCSKSQSIIQRSTLFCINESIINHIMPIRKKQMFFCPMGTGIIITRTLPLLYYSGLRFIYPDGKVADSEQVAKYKAFLNQELNNFFVAETGILLVFMTYKDTHSYILSEIEKVTKVINCIFINCGVVSIPMAHYIVYQFNNELKKINGPLSKKTKEMIFSGFRIEIPSILKIKENYFKILKNFFCANTYKSRIYCDSMNGVAQEVLDNFAKLSISDSLEFISTHKSMRSNNWSEFIKCRQISPEYKLYNKNDDILVFFDSDMERILIYKNNRRFDGDDMISILGEFILNTLFENGIISSFVFMISKDTSLKCEVFLRKIKKKFEQKSHFLLNVDIIRIKHSTGKTIENSLKYDVSIYFEPDGRGGIIFSHDLKARLYDIKTKDKKLLLIKKTMDIFHSLFADPLAVLLFFLAVGDFEEKFENTDLTCHNNEEVEKKKIDIPSSVRSDVNIFRRMYAWVCSISKRDEQINSKI
ncbi:putative phosphoacetylglucosamine mutase [Cucumispora dikerogammari]|nr:putative phosphoacetylglucosamine mutase [Cucumispora dikerogammari]